VKSLDESGTKESDILNNAMKLYERDHKKYKSFSFMHCWSLLKNFPRFFEASRPDTSKILEKRTPSTRSQVSSGVALLFAFLQHSQPSILGPNYPSPSNLAPSNPSPSTFPSRPMGSKQAKRQKGDESERTHTLRRTADATSSLSIDVAKRNKLLA